MVARHVQPAWQPQRSTSQHSMMAWSKRTHGVDLVIIPRQHVHVQPQLQRRHAARHPPRDLRSAGRGGRSWGGSARGRAAHTAAGPWQRPGLQAAWAGGAPAPQQHSTRAAAAALQGAHPAKPRVLPSSNPRRTRQPLCAGPLPCPPWAASGPPGTTPSCGAACAAPGTRAASCVDERQGRRAGRSGWRLGLGSASSQPAPPCNHRMV